MREGSGKKSIANVCIGHIIFNPAREPRIVDGFLLAQERQKYAQE
jgi:hypothetical protein